MPLIEQPLMATSNGRVEGVLVRGMRVEDIRANRRSPATCVAGDIAVDHAGQRQRRDRLAARRDARRSIPGGEITLINPEGRSTVVGTVPREVTYTVGAVFEIGVYDYDKAYVVMPMQDAQDAAADGRPGRDDRDPDDQSRQGPGNPRAAAAAGPGPGVITDWRQMNSALF